MRTELMVNGAHFFQANAPKIGILKHKNHDDSIEKNEIRKKIIKPRRVHATVSEFDTKT